MPTPQLTALLHVGLVVQSERGNRPLRALRESWGPAGTRLTPVIAQAQEAALRASDIALALRVAPCACAITALRRNVARLLAVRATAVDVHHAVGVCLNLRAIRLDFDSGGIRVGLLLPSVWELLNLGPCSTQQSDQLGWRAVGRQAWPSTPHPCALAFCALQRRAMPDLPRSFAKRIHLGAAPSWCLHTRYPIGFETG